MHVTANKITDETWLKMEFKFKDSLQLQEEVQELMRGTNPNKPAYNITDSEIHVLLVTNQGEYFSRLVILDPLWHITFTFL